MGLRPLTLIKYFYILIDMTKMLKPSDIAKKGLIRNSVDSDNYIANYQFVLKLINAGKLKARDYGTGSRKYWLVSEAEIKRFNSEVSN